MKNYYYCFECKRIFSQKDKCPYCGCERTKNLALNAPVNILESKLKGKVIRIKDDTLKVLIKSEGNEKFIKDYTAEQLRKVL